MSKNTKILVFLSIFVIILGSFAIAQKKERPHVLITYKTDVMVMGIHASPCFCEDGLRANFNIISPKNLSVYVSNGSGHSVKVKVTIRYYSIYRTHSWETKERVLTLSAREGNKEVVIWRNNYYDLIQVTGERPITARIEVLGKNRVDPNPDNNQFVTGRTECVAYVY